MVQISIEKGVLDSDKSPDILYPVVPLWILLFSSIFRQICLLVGKNLLMPLPKSLMRMMIVVLITQKLRM